MIGKVALTEKKGQLFLITDEDSSAGHVEGIMLTHNTFPQKVRETNPRLLCDLIDLLDYSKIANETIKLIHRESEKNESKEDKKSLDPIDSIESEVD